MTEHLQSTPALVAGAADGPVSRPGIVDCDVHPCRAAPTRSASTALSVARVGVRPPDGSQHLQSHRTRVKRYEVTVDPGVETFTTSVRDGLVLLHV
jgi:hypothetical protein